MAIPTMNKCCCLQLRWGALIAVLVDLLFTGSVQMSDKGSDILGIFWYLGILVHVVHIVSIILVLVSLCVPNKKLVIPYLITAIICFIVDIIYLILLCIKADELNILALAINVIIKILTIYLWFIVYSWYKKLEGSQDS
ncbi:uncharacterized protein LOC6549354 [Drosophila erecta]|uniref:MARVEL domain-containing protein n=1 Tax=Drosophila erecta TaxID=7220 RepID=B3NRP8_DROER|nr:uncharacterized protein LOC6549354 [Drosophila erecta]EDV56200.1 uncharacterized protein Dere_GG22517 [Drosophila erecta]